MKKKLTICIMALVFLGFTACAGNSREERQGSTAAGT